MLRRVSLALVAIALGGCAGTNSKESAPGEPARRESPDERELDRQHGRTVRAERASRDDGNVPEPARAARAPAREDHAVAGGGGEGDLDRTLDARRITVSFEGTPLGEALDFIRDVTGINMAIAAGAQEKIDQEHLKVTLRLRDVSVRNVLRHVLDVDDDLVCEVRRDMLVVNTRGNVKRIVVTAFYEVSDLMAKRPNYTAPEMGLPQGKGGGGKGGMSGAILTIGDDKEEKHAVGYDADKLVDLVQRLLSEGDTVEIVGSQLMVRASRSTQDKVQSRLEELR